MPNSEAMTAKPRAFVFIDGQNLFHTARNAFGHNIPNYDPHLLARLVCDAHGLSLQAIHFYTGIHSVKQNAKWNDFWNKRFATFGRKGIRVFTRYLQLDVAKNCYNEKGVDVQIAVDMMYHACTGSYDVAVLFSQDTDFDGLVNKILSVAREQKRTIRIISAFPERHIPVRPINNTHSHPISKADYDSCIDPKCPVI